MFGRVDVSGAIVRQSFCPTARKVVAYTAIESAIGMELFVKQANAAFNFAAARVYPLAQELWPRLLGVRFLFRMNVYVLCGKFLGLGFVGLVSAIAQQRAFEGCL